MERTNRILYAAGLAVLITGLSLSAFGQKVTRIRFARGATHAAVSGTLHGFNSEKRFVIRVRAGQTLRTEQIGESHHITIYIDDPGSHEAGDSDASCNNRRAITPTEAGDYRIRVVECQKADRWHGTFRFRVTVR